MIYAEFTTAVALAQSVRAMRERGIAGIETYTPYDDPDVRAALGKPRSKLGWIAGGAALVGGTAAYLVQWWINVADYPVNVGGKPDHSALAFVPITFEMAVLCAGLAVFVATLIASGLPRLYHPVFDVPGFERATIDRFWLAVPACDRHFLGDAVRVVER